MFPTTEHCLLDQHLASSTPHKSQLRKNAFRSEGFKVFRYYLLHHQTISPSRARNVRNALHVPQSLRKADLRWGAVQNHFRHAPLANPYYPLSDVRGLLHLQPRLQLNMLHVLEAPIFGVSNIFYS